MPSGEQREGPLRERRSHAEELWSGCWGASGVGFLPEAVECPCTRTRREWSCGSGLVQGGTWERLELEGGLSDGNQGLKEGGGSEARKERS